jgi:hypothetical protein
VTGIVPPQLPLLKLEFVVAASTFMMRESFDHRHENSNQFQFTESLVCVDIGWIAFHKPK